MELANQFILLSGALLLVAILAGVLSSRIGAPLLLVFLGLGMAFGEEGPGGIVFHDFNTAYAIGSLALAIILFDGGLRTSFSSLRIAWAPASLLATVGVALTAAMTGTFAWLVLDLSPLAALLVGSIVASTDAAAVFLLLHQRGMDLKRRVGTTLEVESGCNDPMAIFLTITLVELLLHGDGEIGWTVARTLGEQMGYGAVIGLAGGWLLAQVVNRLELAPGLYPVFVVAGALVIFGGTQELGGSGFLAVYLAGIIAGNRRLRANQLVRRFHDGIAWVSQIAMFMMLGLLVTPSSLAPDLVPALLIAGGLMFVARPLAVFLCLWPFRFKPEERLFIAWVGLRGAVPIFLAIIPVLGGIDHGIDLFNVAYIVVLTSLLLQGWTVPWLARRLDIELPPRPEPTGRFDMELMRGFDRELVGYRIAETSPMANHPIEDLRVPDRVRILAVLRDNAVVQRQLMKSLKPDDYLLALAPPEQVLLLDRQLLPSRRRSGRRSEPVLGDFAFPGASPVGALADVYDLPVTRREREMSLSDFLQSRLGKDCSVGDKLSLGAIELVVRSMEDGAVQEVGIWLEPAVPHLLPRGLARRVAGAGRFLRRNKTVRKLADDPPL
ncbi:potassium/proton antiporter [Aquibaculum arenosum]|uniref:Potassium/proton antiporter n=1 Tax=Aquibaculum arenosum TaxID=3032591 RepID=A0ABT5YQX6_9PROT|nr:potassium/proton antiporter [Fodinicurvata sp. CAU 1616]MDF2097135.1 potassium/proton antiporter [Fodinicurvata sp. CAU 1616]